MARINIKEASLKRYTSPLLGNGWVETYRGSDAAAIGDTINFGIIPAGIDVSHVAIINDAVAAGTLSLGFEPVGALPAANATFWFTAQSLASAGRAVSIAQPFMFESDVRIIGTLAGAALTAANKVTVVVNGEAAGAL